MQLVKEAIYHNLKTSAEQQQMQQLSAASQKSSKYWLKFKWKFHRFYSFVNKFIGK